MGKWELLSDIEVQWHNAILNTVLLEAPVLFRCGDDQINGNHRNTELPGEKDGRIPSTASEVKHPLSR